MRSKLIALAIIMVLLVIGLLLWPDIRQWIDGSRQDGTQQRISFAVATAGTICLTDSSTHDSRAVTTKTTAKVGALSSEGRIDRNEIRKSVDLAVSEAGLLDERKRVSECMSREMIRLLEVQGLVKPESVRPPPVIEAAKVDQVCVTKKTEALVGPMAIPEQPGAVRCRGGGAFGRGEHLTSIVRLAAAPGFAIVGSVSPVKISDISGGLGTPQYVKDGGGHVVAATVEISCKSPNQVTGPGASMKINLKGEQQRITPPTPSEKADIEQRCLLGGAGAGPSAAAQTATVTGDRNIIGNVGPNGSISISSTGGSK